MAQYDDFSNPPSRPRSSGDPSFPRPTANGGPHGADLGPEAAANNEDWRYRPSSTARRRNQWRQYKHMTPDFGPSSGDLPTAMPQAGVPDPASNAREAALPSFNVKGKPSGHDRSTQGPNPIAGRSADSQGPGSPAVKGTQGLGVQGVGPQSAGGQRAGVQGVGVQSAGPQGLGSQALRPRSPSLHPHSGSWGANPSEVAPQPTSRAHPPQGTTTGAATNVTPLRSRQPRRRAGLAGAVAGLGALAKSSSPDRPPSQSRHFSPQRRLAKLPQPALYAIRLAILGVGVAALAGTLLSVFSPSNVASKGDVAAPTASATRNAASSPGQGAITITAIQPTSELTRLKAQLDQLATLTPGLTPAAYAFDIDSGRYVDLNGTEPVAAASTIKVPILVAFLQQVDAGNLALNQALVLQEQHLAGGSGTLANDAIGSEYTALDVATRMIIHSDNTATNMLIEALGGQEALNQQFATWGLEATVLRNPLPDLEGTNTTSTRDLALLMALVDQGDVLSRRSRERMFSVMQRTVNRSLIAFSLTDGSLVANKTGDIALALGDVALVDTPNGNRYALAIMVQRPNNDGRASELIRRITETVHRELNQPIAPVGRPAAPGEGAPSEDLVSPEGDPRPEESLDPEGSVSPGGTSESPADSSPPAESTPGQIPSGDQIPPG